MTLPNESVFYFFKRTDSASELECAVTLMPLHAESTVGYTFVLTSRNNGQNRTATLENVTRDRRSAEKLFDHICRNRIMPEALADTAKTILTL